MENGRGRMENHVILVAVINIAFGFLELLIALVVLAGMIASGFITKKTEATSVIPFAGSAVLFLLLLSSIPEIIGGFGLLKKKPWARILILIIAFMDLIWIPLGTVIGIYELWTMLHEDTRRLFSVHEKTGEMRINVGR